MHLPRTNDTMISQTPERTLEISLLNLVHYIRKMQEFRVPTGVRALVTFGLGLFSLGLVGSAVVPFVVPNGRRILPIMIVCWIGYACFVWLFWGFFKRTQDVLQADDLGITRIAPGGCQFRLLWADITAVRPREKLQRLDLYDRSGRPVMLLEYQLQNFNVLRRLVFEKTIALYDRESVKDVFYKSKIYFISISAFTLIPLAIAALTAAQGATGLAVLFAAMGLFFAFSALKAPWRVMIKPQSLAISSFSGSREVPWGSIRRIDLGNLLMPNGNSLAAVSVVLEDGNQIKLMQFEDGSLVLYHALHKAWSAHQV
jgi:hypothetical protein